MANVVRLFTTLPVSFLGYYLYGFWGFLCFGQAATLLVLGYYFWLQRRAGLLNPREEAIRFGGALLLFLVCLGLSHLLLAIIPSGWLHLGLKRRFSSQA